jgi:hypothetical protein
MDWEGLRHSGLDFVHASTIVFVLLSVDWEALGREGLYEQIAITKAAQSTINAM